jgi:hypothetical protein
LQQRGSPKASNHLREGQHSPSHFLSYTPKMLLPGPFSLCKVLIPEVFSMSRRKMFWGAIIALGLFSAGLLFA